MNKELKLVLVIAAIIIIGLSALSFIERYIALKQVEHFTENLTKDLEISSEQSRKKVQSAQQEQQRLQALQAQERKRRQQAQIAEVNRIKAQNQQQELEENLLCAKNNDTGKCSCYDKRSGTVVSMSLEQCKHYVDQQFSSY